MSKRKAMRNHVKKFPVKKKFVQSIMRLKRMSPTKQRAAVLGSSNEFIRDVTGVLKRLRHRGDLVKATHHKAFRKHAPKLRKLIHPKTSLKSKRLILSQRGGGAGSAVLPLLFTGFLASVIGMKRASERAKQRL